MPEYLYPGVYIEEIERGPRPIEGVPTSTAAFLGETERGPLMPRLVTSYREYVRTFGATFLDGRYMPHAVNGFFENGGKRLYVSRIVGANAATAAKAFNNDLTVTATGPGAWGNRVWARIVAGSTVGFRLQLAYWTTAPANPIDPFLPADRNKTPRPQLIEDYDDLSPDPTSSNYYKKRLTDSNTNLSLSALVDVTRPPANEGQPVPPAAAGFLAAGADAPAAPTDVEYKGAVVNGVPTQGLAALDLDAYRDVALVYAPFPPNATQAVLAAIIDHCELKRFRFGVIDGARSDVPKDMDPRNTRETQYAACYAPWIWISDPTTGARMAVPPGGHVLGIYGRSDAERGVFKAPANETVRGALDLVFDIDDGTQAAMNPRGVNAIRHFPGRGILVWGARTLTTNGLWKYVSVRRLFIFIERSIYEGTQWVVFEPNDERLWARVKDSIRLFLRTQWREGALFGSKEEEAFFITCDRTTMTQDDILNGRLICEIGIAPVRPAEFVIFRVFQYTAEAQR